MKQFITRISAALALGGALLTFADIAQPIAPVAAYIMIGSGILLLIFLIIRFLFKVKGEVFTTVTYFVGIICVLSTSLFAFQQNTPASKKSGFLATNIESFKSLQGSLGLIQKDVSIIRDGVKSIDAKMDNVKKETSTNPRKELANMGISWNGKSFGDAMLNGDHQTVALFLQGGINPTINHDSYGYPGVSVLVRKNPKHTIKMLDALLKHGMDINSKLEPPTVARKETLLGIVRKNYNLLKRPNDKLLEKYLVSKGAKL